MRLRVEYTKSSGSGGDYGSIPVCAQRNVNPFTGAIPAIDGISLESLIEMRMEDNLPATIVFPAPTASNPNPPAVYAEPLTAGRNWSGC